MSENGDNSAICLLKQSSGLEMFLMYRDSEEVRTHMADREFRSWCDLYNGWLRKNVLNVPAVRCEILDDGSLRPIPPETPEVVLAVRAALQEKRAEIWKKYGLC